MLDPDLFIRPDGLPMAFIMSYKGAERETVKKVVEDGGGILLEQTNLVYRDHIVKLLVQAEVVHQRKGDSFDYRYVIDCVKENMILANLMDYRINSHLPSTLEQYDPLDILLGYKRWKDVPEVMEGDIISDVESDEFDDVASKQKVFKSIRFPYRKKNQQEILNFLVKFSAYKLVKGNSIWQKMEENGVCGGARTWQSMKEHFRKKIVPLIHSYGLTWRQVRRFRAVFGLDQELESDEEEEVEMELTRKVRGKRRIQTDAGMNFQPRRSSSPKVSSNIDTANENSDDNIDHFEPVEDIIEVADEMAKTEMIAMRRKRKLFSTNVSYLDPDTEEEGDTFKVTPVKKRKVLSDIVEIEQDDEVIEVIQSDDLDTAMINSEESSQADISEAVNTIEPNFGLEKNNEPNNDKNASRPILVDPIINLIENPSNLDTPENVQLIIPSDSCSDANKAFVETLDDIFDDDGFPSDCLTASNLPPAKRKSVSNQSLWSKSDSQNQSTVVVKRTAEPLIDQPNYPFHQKDTHRSSSLLMDTYSKSSSPVKDSSRSSSPLKHRRMSSSPTKGRNRSISPLKDNHRSSSPRKPNLSVQVQLRKLVLLSPHSLCCRSINSVTGRKGRQEVVDRGVVAGERVDEDVVDNTDNNEDQVENTAAEQENSDRQFWYDNRSRQPYSRGEEEAVVNFFLRNGGYSVKGGNMVWKKMEDDWICPGRTWQSLRTRFDKSILKNLKHFGVKEEQLIEVDRKLRGPQNAELGDLNPRGFRQNVKYYTKAEDLKVLNFIAENRRFEDVRGNEVWQVIEERRVLEGRSWQSMKERFRKAMLKRIQSYGLSEEILAGLGRLSGKKKEKRMT